jgi:hypothetical protein
VISPVRLSLFLLALACSGTAAPAEMMVSAVIPSRLRLQFHDVPRTVNIRPADVARGYVDAESPVGLSVQSNSARGVVIEITSSNEHVRGATVSGLAHDVIVGRSGGAVFLPGPRIDANLMLQFRFHLSSDTPPGIYPWPVHLAAAS